DATEPNFRFDFQLPLTPPAGTRTLELEGFGRGAVRPSNRHRGTELLSSFFFMYEGNPGSHDNHLQAIGITPDQPSRGHTTLIFQAFSPDSRADDYYYHVGFLASRYQDVSTSKYGREACVGGCTRALGPPPAGHVFALRGFYIYYLQEDHHLD